MLYATLIDLYFIEELETYEDEYTSIEYGESIIDYIE